MNISVKLEKSTNETKIVCIHTAQEAMTTFPTRTVSRVFIASGTPSSITVWWMLGLLVNKRIKKEIHFTMLFLFC